MSIQCPHCQTVLMGAVNRCWNCGKSPHGLPTTTISEGQADARGEDAIQLMDDGQSGTVPTAERATPPTPFAPPPAHARVGTIRSRSAPSNYPKNLANRAGAILAVALGVIALIEVSFVPVGAVFTALIGLACGVWGIRSNRRKSSSFGMVLCCIALAAGAFYTAMAAYEYYWDVNPLRPNEIVEPVDSDDPFGDPSF
ncbi:MAG: hypothetical protein KDB14_01490 [Planctomycetales bacterium]|nr:hypothetical protein [Planctomycetales bacterium]